MKSLHNIFLKMYIGLNRVRWNFLLDHYGLRLFFNIMTNFNPFEYRNYYTRDGLRYLKKIDLLYLIWKKLRSLRKSKMSRSSFEPIVVLCMLKILISKIPNTKKKARLLIISIRSIISARVVLVVLCPHFLQFAVHYWHMYLWQTYQAW